MSDEYMDTTKASEILSKVIAESNIGYGENRDGVLTPEQTVEFIRDTDWEDKVYVYREFKPTRDTIEYTVYFRAPVDGVSKKFRCDWEFDMRDLDALGQSGEITPHIVFSLKSACRIRRREQTYVYRQTGVAPAVQPHTDYS